MNKKYASILLVTIVPLILIIIVTIVSLNNINTTTLQSANLSEAVLTTSKVAEKLETSESEVSKKIVKNEYMAKAQGLFDKTHYKKAQEVLTEALNIIPNDTELTSLMIKAKSASENPVIYKGKIYHVFFHSLIVYPEL